MVHGQPHGEDRDKKLRQNWPVDLHRQDGPKDPRGFVLSSNTDVGTVMPLDQMVLAGSSYAVVSETLWEAVGLSRLSLTSVIVCLS